MSDTRFLTINSKQKDQLPKIHDHTAVIWKCLTNRVKNANLDLGIFYAPLSNCTVECVGKCFVDKQSSCTTCGAINYYSLCIRSGIRYFSYDVRQRTSPCNIFRNIILLSKLNHNLLFLHFSHIRYVVTGTDQSLLDKLDIVLIENWSSDPISDTEFSSDPISDPEFSSDIVSKTFIFLLSLGIF